MAAAGTAAMLNRMLLLRRSLPLPSIKALTATSLTFPIFGHLLLTFSSTERLLLVNKGKKQRNSTVYAISPKKDPIPRLLSAYFLIFGAWSWARASYGRDGSMVPSDISQSVS